MTFNHKVGGSIPSGRTMTTIFGKGSYCCYCFAPVSIDNAGMKLEDGELVAYDVCVECAMIEGKGYGIGWYWRE